MSRLFHEAADAAGIKKAMTLHSFATHDRPELGSGDGLERSRVGVLLRRLADFVDPEFLEVPMAENLRTNWTVAS